MDSALGDLVADADDADGGRDDSEDDEEVLGRSFTKGARGVVFLKTSAAARASTPKAPIARRPWCTSCCRRHC